MEAMSQQQQQQQQQQPSSYSGRSACGYGTNRYSVPSPNYSYHHQQQQRACTAGSTTRTRTDRRVAKENHDLITSLYRRNEEIMRDYSILRNKHQNVLSNNGKLKKEVQSLRLRSSGNYRPRTSVFPTSSSFARTGACMRLAEDARSSHCAKRRQANESDSLSEALASTASAYIEETDRHHLPSDPPIFATKDPTGVAFHLTSLPSDQIQTQESLVKELADATSKVHSLKEKHGKLEFTCNECLDKLEQTKHDLEAARRDKVLLEEEVTELRLQNASLEEKVTQLCCDEPITSIRLSSVATSTSSIAARCPASPTSPTDEIEEDNSDENSSGFNNSVQSIPEETAAAAAAAVAAEEEVVVEEEKVAEAEASPASALPSAIATGQNSSNAAIEGVSADVNKAAASPKVESEDTESHSSYQDEAFDEYADDSFEQD